MIKAFVAPTVERAARGSSVVPGSNPGEGTTIPLPAYRYVERLMAQQTSFTDLEFQELRKAAWLREQRENYWGSAHIAPRYLDKINKNIAALTAKENAGV